MTASLSGQVIVVTGAATGIGRAIVQACLAEDALVVAVGRTAAPLAALAAEVASSGRGESLATMQVDIRSERDVAQAMDLARSRFGGLNSVVANAGVFGHTHSFLDVSLDEWNDIICTNLTGTFITLREGARALVQGGVGGSLLVIGSSTAVRAMKGTTPYAASKGAVHTMVRGLALELGESAIRVNGIVPGTTETTRNLERPEFLERARAALPLREAVPVEEVGALAAFLLGPQARHMTGSLVSLDAGRTIA